MANYVLTNPMIFLNEHDLTGNLTAATLNYAAELVEDTCMGESTKSRVGGLKTIIFDCNGFIDMAEPDKEMFDNIAYNNSRMTICPTTGADGEPAYFWRPVLTTYTMKATLGEKYSFNLHAEQGISSSYGPLIVPGIMGLGKTTETATDTGTPYQLGAVGATQKLVAMLHCFSASAGDTLDVIIESDNDVGFGSPTTRITFTQVAAATATSEYAHLAGPVADDWFRVKFTIAGADPSFTFAVAFAVV